MKIDYEKLVRAAYKKLKQEIYYDNVDLFTRKKLAEFESSKRFEDKLDKLAEFLNQEDVKSDYYIQLLDQISFNLMPKNIKIDAPDQDCAGCKNNQKKKQIEGVLISNVRIQDKYEIEGIEYFIDAPIELHIISIIWLMFCGVILEEEISEDVYANRLHKDASNESTTRMMKIYHKQYAEWRDGAINEAKDLLKKEKNVLIVSLDIKKYFYNINMEDDPVLGWKTLTKKIEESSEPQKKVFNTFINKCLKKIHFYYAQSVKDFISTTHGIENRKYIVPIGLRSSGVISNWYLKEFDQAIIEQLNPEYYGRYCDDMLIVLKNPIKKVVDAGVGEILKKYFSNLLEKKNDHYELKHNNGCVVQKEKLIIQYFDRDHSPAGINEFANEIKRASSEFRFLPEDELQKELDQSAYDVLYKGSINKFRSVIGLAENATELSKYLGKQLIAHRLSKKTNSTVSNQLMKFYQGRNIFNFMRLWEKVFSFFLIDTNKKNLSKFYKKTQKLISDLHYADNNEIQKKLRDDANRYLCIAVSMPLSLIQDIEKEQILLKKDSKVPKDILENMICLRKSGLLRHDLVEFPLLNYTDYEGDYISFDYKNLSPDLFFNVKEETKKITYSPRYIHYDECQLYCWYKSLVTNSSDGKYLAHKCDLKTCRIRNTPKSWTISSSGSKHELIRHIKIDTAAKDYFHVAIANLKVRHQDIEKSYKPSGTPNLSFSRQAQLYKLINSTSAEKINGEKIDLLILPEVSVPYHWLPFMVSHARRSQIGMVFGVEHITFAGYAYNMIATVLPFKEARKYRSAYLSLRLKNHYAPQEIAELEKYSLNIPKNSEEYYEIFNWRGVSFSVFNCFELADIQHRASMRSEIDFLIASVWNKDTNYYSNIVESAARDIHCYVAQVNTSDFGDSRVTAPLKSFEKDLVKVKGGENTTILTTTLNIKELREFQIKNYSEIDNKFKPIPPGFNKNKVLERMMENNQ